MRAETALVALIAGRGKTHVDKYVGVVAGHVRIAVPAVILAVNSELPVVIPGTGCEPAHPLHGARREDLLIAGLAELVGIALEDNDVPRLDAGRFQPLDHFQQHLRPGDRADRAP